jgi:thiol peroxidase
MSRRGLPIIPARGKPPRAGGLRHLLFLSVVGLAAAGCARSGGAIVRAGTAEVDAALRDGPAVVLFSAPDCRCCHSARHVLARLARRYAGRVNVFDADVTRSPELAGRFALAATPTVVLLERGGEVRRLTGPVRSDEYEAMFAEASGGKPAARQERKAGTMKERPGAVTFKGDPLTLLGDEVKVGQKAPDFTAVDNSLKDTGLKDFAGKVVLIASVPSLDTKVCDTEARRFNESASALGDDVVVLVISMDLPFAQARWCGAAGIENVCTLSDHRDASFAQAYGVLIKELRLLARAVWVIDRQGEVRYHQLVGEMTDQPDYEAALDAARQAALQ